MRDSDLAEKLLLDHIAAAAALSGKLGHGDCDVVDPALAASIGCRCRTHGAISDIRAVRFRRGQRWYWSTCRRIIRRKHNAIGIAKLALPYRGVGSVMSNIATLLKSEISRLSRREIRKEVQPLRKSAAAHRREIASLKRTIATLERRSKQISKQASFEKSVPSSDAKPTRFVAKGLVSLRRRLGLSAADLARLLGVSMQSVYNWERKKSTPRKEQVGAIAALRGIGKTEAHQRLETSGERRSGTRVAKRSSKKRGAKRPAAEARPIR